MFIFCDIPQEQLQSTVPAETDRPYLLGFIFIFLQHGVSCLIKFVSLKWWKNRVWSLNDVVENDVTDLCHWLLTHAGF